MENKSKRKLLKSLDIFAISFGAMIGWGWVVSSGNWINKAGVFGSIIGFIIAGVMIYFIGLAYAELTTMMPNNGGCLIFSLKGLGKTGSFICSWFMLFSYIGVVCFEAASLPTVISLIFPQFLQGYMYTINGFNVYATWLILSIFTSIIITYINIKGLKISTYIQNILTLIIGLSGLLLIFSSFISGSVENLNTQLFVGDTIINKASTIFSIATIAPFFLFGFDIIPQTAEDIKIEAKKIGKILLISIISAVVFYSLIILSIGLSIDNMDIKNILNNNGIVTFEALRIVLKNNTFAKIILFGGICGILTSWNSFMIGGSRILESMANHKLAPKRYSKLVKKTDVPVNALIMICIISIIIPFFGIDVLEWVSTSASFSCCLAYLLVSISYIRIRQKYPDDIRPFSVKHWKLCGFLAIFLSAILVFLFLIPGTSASLIFPELLILFVWAVVGITYYFLSIKKSVL